MPGSSGPELHGSERAWGRPILHIRGWPLPHKVVAAVREALRRAGLISTDYAGHSFRIGAATTAAQKGVQDSLIKTLG